MLHDHGAVVSTTGSDGHGLRQGRPSASTATSPRSATLSRLPSSRAVTSCRNSSRELCRRIEVAGRAAIECDQHGVDPVEVLRRFAEGRRSVSPSDRMPAMSVGVAASAERLVPAELALPMVSASTRPLTVDMA